MAGETLRLIDVTQRIGYDASVQGKMGSSRNSRGNSCLVPGAKQLDHLLRWF